VWHGIQGHDRVVNQFRTAIARGRLGHTFLFVGPPGVGKRTFAMKLAQALLCDARPQAALDPCGQCVPCRQIEAGSHPDLHVVERPREASNLPLELFIGDDEHRMQAGLCYELSLKPYSGKRRIGIIDDADLLSMGSRESANALLKTLEEPPPKSVLILIGTSVQRQLPTIRSRCQIVRFSPLAEETVAELLMRTGACEDAAAARRAAQLAQGSLERGRAWCDKSFVEFREALLQQLAAGESEPASQARLVQQFVEEAGKDAPSKRARMRLATEMASEFYGALTRYLTGAAIGGDEALRSAVAAAARWWPGGCESAAGCQEICLDALAHVDANANLTALVEWWLDELSLRAVGAGRG
jgi:DNA polymerase-3 subunit delta'